jgi:hypothetical protein
MAVAVMIVMVPRQATTTTAHRCLSKTPTVTQATSEGSFATCTATSSSSKTSQRACANSLVRGTSGSAAAAFLLPLAAFDVWVLNRC